MNSYASFLGSVGIGIGLTRAIPQLVKLLRARRAHGVSLDTATTSSIVSLGWATYGIWTKQIFVSLSSGFSGVIFAIIAFFAMRFGRSAREFKVAPTWLVVLLLSGLVAEKNGLGIILPISVLAANVPQLWVAYKEDDLIDLSLGTWALSLTEGLVWGIYSLLQNDISIMASSFFQSTTSGLIVLLKFLRLAREKNIADPDVNI